ncbi:helix-turn-helix transcriptional regulator [Lachnospiraceae bacterium NSJ-12]|uniref:Helix-turn-helix transcriptional regulator n=2 Tax=Zhenhengia yiwuensis TaxID=2763666 RepID=A0A926EK67_9FIRM|nr:helix-turn-helix transcriptional regulator [Zhenhengia yiwuensis]
MHQRIKELRKKHLKLSQESFGKQLGVSRSVINNIERNCLARPDQKLSLIKLMCKEFNVNEDWILNGNEPMFTESDMFSLDKLVHKHGGSDLDLEFLNAYFELDVEIRTAFIEHFKKRLSIFPNRNDAPRSDCPNVPEKLESEFPPVQSSQSDIV